MIHATLGGELNDNHVHLAWLLLLVAHDGQEDKQGRAYWGHPKEVGDCFDEYDAKIVGYLHDTLEDTDLSAGTIYNLFGKEVGDAVRAVTRQKGETYPAFINRIAASSELARMVKIADLRCNLHWNYKLEPVEGARLKKRYDAALDVLCATFREWRLEHTDTFISNVHNADACFGEQCAVHHRTYHSMREFPQHWRNDRKLMERVCPHGVGHPDPDHLAGGAKLHGEEWADTVSIHGCDGCCYGAYERLPSRVIL